MIDSKVTEDKLLNGKITLRQPAKGYRTAIDPIFLSAAVNAQSGEKVLDVGTGTGAALLCLAKRIKCHIVGIDNQPTLTKLAQENILLNKLESQTRIINSDLTIPPQDLMHEKFNQVMSNPPYFDHGTPSPYHNKANANFQSTASMEQWIQFCTSMLAPNGVLTFIFRTDRLNDLLASLMTRMKNITLFPLWPKINQPCKRILVQAKNHARRDFTVASGLILHRENGEYTPQAEQILREGKGINL